MNLPFLVIRMKITQGKYESRYCGIYYLVSFCAWNEIQQMRPTWLIKLINKKGSLLGLSKLYIIGRK